MSPHGPSRRSSDHPHLAMPLGGIGTGNLAIAADGGLRQWQLHNIGNHLGSLPHSFLALRVTRIEPPLEEVRILQAAPSRSEPATPLVTDDHVPGWLTALLDVERPMSSAAFRATYPVAEVSLSDDRIPLDVTLEAFTPMVPLDTDVSSLPVAMLTVRLTNRDAHALHGSLGVAQQNPVGWDGVSPIDGVAGAGYGGNVNRLERRSGWTSVVMDNVVLPDDHPGQGQFVVAVDASDAAALLQWRRPEEMTAFLRSRALNDGSARLRDAAHTADPQWNAPSASVGPSPAGSTWNAGLAVPFWLEPGESRSIRVLLAWSFPNRYVNFEQFGPPRPEWGRSRFWLGNHYATRYPDARTVREDVVGRWHDLRDATLAWTATWRDSSLDDRTVEHLAAQLSLIRSPTCFRSADGRFLAFEGTLGASSTMWSGDVGGSCPLNCTHVWNYEHALARAYPDLERSMRETEFDISQAPEGYLPHRVIAPVYLRQLWGEFIGGPDQPALDGMLGAVLKTYREYRGGAGRPWLERYWPSVVRLLAHVREGWLEESTGLLVGIQPSTHDIDLCGVNSYMGTLWLAALRAAEEMALLLDDPDTARLHRETFDRASASYDAELWNGEYYEQKLREGDRTDHQWVRGCLSDQLIGQWWAHQLELGPLLPVEHVRSALRAVVKYNLRHGFRDFEHPFRVYADGDDTGLLMCSWPDGGRPDVPTRYADEIWTGIEYQVAAHCLWEGMADEAQQILDGMWDRHDGRRRNPYNEIECGDHYARAMAGWTVLEAMSGFRHDEPSGRITLRVPDDGTAVPFLAATGWGLIVREGAGVEIHCRGGTLSVTSVIVDGTGGRAVRVVGDGDATVRVRQDGRVVATPVHPRVIETGERLGIALG